VKPSLIFEARQTIKNYLPRLKELELEDFILSERLPSCLLAYILA
jgi:uncharacterized protein YbbK (DUF523 family)